MKKYCGGLVPGVVRASVHDSPIWKRHYKVRHMVQNNIFWALGAGEVSFWHDYWFGDGPLASLLEDESYSHFIVNFLWKEKKMGCAKTY